MTRDEIIAMARSVCRFDSWWINNEEKLEQFAALVVSAKDAEIARLNDALRWEQSRAERVGTHGPGCWKWGPSHYECALREIRARGEV